MVRVPAIGIDLGTTSARVAVCQNGKVEIIVNERGNCITPSYVAFNDSERLIGDAAKQQAEKNPVNTIFATTRLLGRKFDDTAVQEDMKHWPFEVKNVDNKPMIACQYKGDNKLFTPEEILAMILGKLKQTAEAHLGETVTDAVITVPACFTFAQREATEDAASIAGLRVMRYINQATAAGLAYSFDEGVRRNVLLFDLGGGTSNVSIMEFDDGILEIKSTAGNTHLGGEDFNCRLINHCIKEFKKKHKKDLIASKRALCRLRIACEQAKLDLTVSSETNIDIGSLYEDIDLKILITRACFEKMNDDLFRTAIDLVEQALRYARMLSRIDEIVMFGGSARIPKVQEMLGNIFPGKKLIMSTHAHDAAAYGAAVQAAIWNDDRSGNIGDFMLLDVLPLSLGIETAGGLMKTVIRRSTTTPTKQTISNTIDCRNQNMLIKVFEGESRMTKNNNLLGELELSEILSRRSNDSKVEVTFDVDANSILKVTVSDIFKKEKTITITKSKDRLSKEDIERMVKEAEQYRLEDEKRKETISAKNELEACCYKLKNGILDTVNKEIDWLNKHQQEEKGVYKRRQDDLEALLGAINKIAKHE